MKKIIYLCGMMLICLNTMAQIDLNDKNWECFIDEDFSGNRSWDCHWDDTKDIPNYIPLWRCFLYSNWGSGVTIYDYKKNKYKGFHAYQPSHAVFSADNTMKLICEFISSSCLHCGKEEGNYTHAPWHKYCHYCEDFEKQHPNVHYYSGMIETIDPVGFGYYEIECKMPIHPGESSSFWLWSCLGGTYNEIDVFEHSMSLCSDNMERSTLNGIWYNPLGTNYNDPDSANAAIRFADHLHILPTDTTTLDEYHTFGCLWLPERVVWYVDGEIVNVCEDSNQIPQFPMWLKITHRNDVYAYTGTGSIPWWTETDTMTINYVKAYRLLADCNSNVIIRNITDFNNYEYKTRHSITIGGLSNPLIISDTCRFTMRAVESIVIDGAFELPQGAEMTLIVHSCPQCSMEGVVLPEYNCGMSKEDE